jgi:hypothetical protein
MGFIFITAGLCAVYWRESVNAARGQRTFAEMSAILEAGKAYYSAYGAWPAAVEQTGEYLSKMPGKNVWGREYAVFQNDVRFWVETYVAQDAPVPAGQWAGVIATVSDKEKVWRMGVPLSYGVTARLVYEK